MKKDDRFILTIVITAVSSALLAYAILVGDYKQGNPCAPPPGEGILPAVCVVEPSTGLKNRGTYILVSGIVTLSGAAYLGYSARRKSK